MSPGRRHYINTAPTRLRNPPYSHNNGCPLSLWLSLTVVQLLSRRLTSVHTHKDPIPNSLRISFGYHSTPSLNIGRVHCANQQDSGYREGVCVSIHEGLWKDKLMSARERLSSYLFLRFQTIDAHPNVYLPARSSYSRLIHIQDPSPRYHPHLPLPKYLHHTHPWRRAAAGRREGGAVWASQRRTIKAIRCLRCAR